MKNAEKWLTYYLFHIVNLAPQLNGWWLLLHYFLLLFHLPPVRWPHKMHNPLERQTSIERPIVMLPRKFIAIEKSLLNSNPSKRYNNNWLIQMNVNWFWWLNITNYQLLLLFSLFLFPTIWLCNFIVSQFLQFLQTLKCSLFIVHDHCSAEFGSVRFGSMSAVSLQVRNRENYFVNSK